MKNRSDDLHITSSSDPRHYDAYFAAVLTPHRSLSSTGFLILMAGIGLSCIGATILFFWIGAWPVIGFFGLDALLIWMAFRINYASAEVSEHIHIDNLNVTVERFKNGVLEVRHSFNPIWVHLRLLKDTDDMVSSMKIEAQSKVIPLGSFLNREEKTSLSQALLQALAKAKAGGFLS